MAKEFERKYKTWYPTTVFPTRTRSDGKEAEVMFSDYGCFEAADIDHSEVEPRIFLKRHHFAPDKKGFMSGYHDSKTVDARVLCPEHDLMMLGRPEPIENLIPDVTFRDLYSMQRIVNESSSSKKQAIGTSVKDHYYNLSWDHGDVTVNTFLDLMYNFHGQNFKDETSKQKSDFNCSRNFGVSGSLSFNKHFDTSLCDVSCETLNDLILEGIQSQGVELYCDRDFSGSCLSYQNLSQSSDQQFGFLACAQGQALDEFAVKLLSTSFNDEQDDNDNGFCNASRNEKYSVPHIEVMSEYRQTLNGRILQTEIISSDDPDIHFLGIRSDYHVLLDRLNCQKIDLNTEKSSTELISDDAISSVGCLKSSKRFMSIALSPYIAGECTFATEDNCVQLWNTNMPTQTDSNGSLGRVLMNGSAGGLRSIVPWRQVVYGAHPRQLYIADTGNVCVFDLRTQHDTVTLLNMSSSEHTKQNEHIYCISSGRNLDNEFQCLVATEFNLFLMDQRHCREPLSQWGTNMSLPPLYISPTHVCTSETPSSEFSMHDWSYNTKAVLLANQHPQEVHCYQFCNTTRRETNKVTVTPPQAIGPPRILGNFKSVSRHCRKYPSKHSSYLESRLSKKLVGLDVISMDKKEAVVMLQMNSVGDIGYQTLSMKHPSEAYDMGNILTGETASCMVSNEKRATKNAIEKTQKLNYDHWIESVCKQQEEVPYCDKGITLHTTKCSIASRFRKQLLQVDLVLNKSELCEFCSKNRLENYDSDSDNKKEIVATNFCNLCGCDIKKRERIYEIFKNDSKRSTALTRDSLVISEDEDRGSGLVEELNLINIEDSTPDEGDDDDKELGRLLKETWAGTYEEYWEKLKCREKRKEIEEKKLLKQRTFDLSYQQENENSDDILKKGKLKEHNSTSRVINNQGLTESKRGNTTIGRNPNRPTPTLQDWLSSKPQFNPCSLSASSTPSKASPKSKDFPELGKKGKSTFLGSPRRHSQPLPSFSPFSPNRKTLSLKSKLKDGSNIKKNRPPFGNKAKNPKLSVSRMGF